MKTIQKILAGTLLTIGFTSFAQTTNAQSIDIKAAEKYWEITEALRRNQPLSDDTWKEFLELQGNKVYVKSVFNGEKDLNNYRKALEVVYMPQQDSLLQAKLKAGSWYYVLVNDYKTNEEQHREFLRKTSEDPRYLDKMYTLAYEYLPERAHKKVADLKLYYTALGNDATSQQEGIFFSIRSAIDWNMKKEGALEAHEIHHQIRPRKDFGDIEEADMGLLWAVASIQNEGPADLIDKKVMIEAGGQDAEEISNWILKPAPAIIQQLDTAILALAKNNAAASQPRKYYSNMFKGSGGHIPGFYMATVIENNGYSKAMLKTIDDPFAFIRLYQKAAKKDKTKSPVFSKASMAYLKKLEQKYTASKQEKKVALSVK